MAIIIQEAVSFEPKTFKLSKLKDHVTKGNEGFEPLFSTVSGALQRINQSEEWKKDNFKRSKEFMHCVITGAGALDNIIIVPVKLVLKGLEDKSKIEPDIPKEIWKETIKQVKADQESGTMYYIIDGQNRLVNAIKGFYEGTFALGDKIITAKDDGEEYVLSGQKYADLPLKYREYIDNINLTVLLAQKGDIDSFVDSLIAKNEGLSWEPWMKLITKKWYTLYRKKISEITSNTQVKNTLNKINGRDYSYDKNGHDLIISELLIWMKDKNQINKPNQHIPYFDGLEKIKDSYFDKLKKYIQEFGKGYAKIPTIQNVEFRNYIMFRFGLDHRAQFPTIAFPKFKPHMTVDFVNQYRIYNKVLREDKNGRKSVIIGDKTVTTKVPGFYYWACSEIAREHINCRLKLLSEKFIDNTNKLVSGGIVKEIKVEDPMPSIETIYDHNSIEVSMGESLRPSEVSADFYDRGHLIAKKNGGTNDIDNLALHEKSHNRSIKDTNII